MNASLAWYFKEHNQNSRNLKKMYQNCYYYFEYQLANNLLSTSFIANLQQFTSIAIITIKAYDLYCENMLDLLYSRW